MSANAVQKTILFKNVCVIDGVSILVEGEYITQVSPGEVVVPEGLR
ncbi:MAG: hypothetical protein AB9Q23_10575 [Candidatus Reddybacter sp.]